jgi:hypothetical protein
MTEQVFEYPNSDHGERVELPEEKAYNSNPVLSANISNVPLELERRLKEAHRQGRLRDSLDHWLGALDGAQIIDKSMLKTLRQMAGEITGNYLADQPVVEKLRKAIVSLRSTKI